MGSLEKELSVGLRIDFSVKSMVLSRRLVGKPPYICFTAKITDFIPNPPSRLCRATSFAKGG